jgi:hypothetical protein
LLPSKHEHDWKEQFGHAIICEHCLVDPGVLQMFDPPPPVVVVVVDEPPDPEPVPNDPPAPPAPTLAPPAPEPVVPVMPGPPMFAAWLHSGGAVQGVPQ